MPTPDLPSTPALSGTRTLDDGFVLRGLTGHPYIQSWGVLRDKDGSTTEHFITLQNGSPISGGMLMFTSRRTTQMGGPRLPIRRVELLRVHNLNDSMLRKVAYFHAFDRQFLEHIRAVPGWEDFTPNMTNLRAPRYYDSVVAERTRIQA